MLSVPPVSDRPTPEEVRSWFAGRLGAESLAAYLRVLMQDPNWMFLAQPAPEARTFTFHYGPTDEHVVVRLIDQGDHWYATLQLQR